MTPASVIVTGGTGGAGVGVVRAVLEEGFRVIVSYVDEREVERARRALGDRATLVRADVAGADGVRALVVAAEREAPLWGLVHLVGGYADGSAVEEGDVGLLREQVALNMETLAVAMGAVVPRLRGNGGRRVVGVSSRAAVTPFAGGGAYAAAKAGVIALVEAAALEARDAGVTVNCVLPSVIDTPANRAAMPDAEPAQWVSPAELGAVVALLLSSGSSAITGAAIPVYGRV